jgi:thioredoxin 1
MRAVSLHTFCLLVLLAMSTATPSPSASATTHHHTCAAKNNSNNSNNNVFGVPEAKLAKVAMTRLRGGGGGELHEPETLREVEALVLGAATGRKLVVIDFTASWCGPCKAIAPLYKELAEEFGDDVVFLKVDVDENPDTAAKYSVSAMPTFVFISGGSVVDRLMGVSGGGWRCLCLPCLL